MTAHSSSTKNVPFEGPPQTDDGLIAGGDSEAASMHALALTDPTEAHDTPDERFEYDPAQATAAALREYLGGLEIVDDGLELESGVRVEHVGRDVSGNLCLILMLSGRGSSSLAAALDLVAFARSHRSVLLQVYGIEARRRVRVVLVAEHYDTDLRRRLEALEPCGVELVRIGALRTARGERLFALSLSEPPIQVAPAADAAAADRSELNLETFLCRLEPGLAERVQSIVSRFARIDE
ncbi:MAG: hypothetical protein AAFZ65_17425, partial [Planctomycetota bacterium]